MSEALKLDRIRNELRGVCMALALAGALTAASEGPGLGTTAAIELPVPQAAVYNIESDTNE